MYNVLNNEWEKLIVKTINPQIHKHLSGRDFTEDDDCVISKDNTVEVIQEEIEELDSQVNEITEELTRKQSIEAYTEKYGKKPSHLMKTENIIAKL